MFLPFSRGSWRAHVRQIDFDERRWPVLLRHSFRMALLVSLYRPLTPGLSCRQSSICPDHHSCIWTHHSHAYKSSLHPDRHSRIWTRHRPVHISPLSSIQIVHYLLSSFFDPDSSRSRGVCNLIHVSVLRLFFASLALQVKLFDVVSSGVLSPQHCSPTSSYFPTDRRPSRAATPLRHLHCHLVVVITLVQQCHAPMTPLDLDSPRSSSSRSRDPACSLLSLSAFLFLTTRLLPVSTLLLLLALLQELRHALLRCALVVSFVLFLTFFFASLSSESLFLGHVSPVSMASRSRSSRGLRFRFSPIT